jgi:hypothetical protein
MMTHEAFLKATEEELKLQTKTCFDDATAMSGGSWDRRAAKLLEAQFYMQELDRRHDGKISRRDFRMELIVIALIGLELIAASWGIVIAIREGKEQQEMTEKLWKAMMRAGNTNLTR